MRAALLPHWPALTETYGIHPHQVGLYSLPELNQYLHALDRKARAAQKSRRR